MLREGEMCFSARAQQSFTITWDGFSAHSKGTMVTFKGWKLVSHRRTIPFDYIDGTGKEVYSAIKNWLKVRDALNPTTANLFTTDDGKALQRWDLQPSCTTSWTTAHMLG